MSFAGGYFLIGEKTEKIIRLEVFSFASPVQVINPIIMTGSHPLWKDAMVSGDILIKVVGHTLHYDKQQYLCAPFYTDKHFAVFVIRVGTDYCVIREDGSYLPIEVYLRKDGAWTVPGGIISINYDANGFGTLEYK